MKKTPVCIISHKINPLTGKEYGKYYVLPETLLLRKNFSESRGHSIGESMISYFLDEHYIDYINGYKIDRTEGLGKNNGLVFIDFSFSFGGKIYWIEYNGEQHYNFIKFFHDSEEDYLKQKRRDDNVRAYAKSHNIIFIEIPYTYKTLEEINILLENIIIKGNLNYPIIIPPRQ